MKFEFDFTKGTDKQIRYARDRLRVRMDNPGPGGFDELLAFLDGSMLAEMASRTDRQDEESKKTIAEAEKLRQLMVIALSDAGAFLDLDDHPSVWRSVLMELQPGTTIEDVIEELRRTSGAAPRFRQAIVNAYDEEAR